MALTPREGDLPGCLRMSNSLRKSIVPPGHQPMFNAERREVTDEFAAQLGHLPAPCGHAAGFAAAFTATGGGAAGAGGVAGAVTKSLRWPVTLTT